MPFEAMTNLTGNHVRLFKKITASGLVCLLLLAGLPAATAAAENCKGWKTAKFFKSATVEQVRACLSAGEDPNEPDTKGLTALHRAARETRDPAVIEALLDAGANPRSISIAGRRPWDYARTNGKIKGSAAYQRLWIAGAKAAKKASWSRVQAVPRDTKTEVRLYQDAAPRGNRKIKGRFESSTADSITLVLKDGQTRTVQKQAVRKVLPTDDGRMGRPGNWHRANRIRLEYRPATHCPTEASGPRNVHSPGRGRIFLRLADERDLQRATQNRTRPAGGPQSGGKGKAPEKPEGPPQD